MKETKYPGVVVQLSDEDGNAFAILGRVRRAMRRYGVDPSELTEFTNEASSGDYGHLLRTCAEWVTVK